MGVGLDSFDEPLLLSWLWQSTPLDHTCRLCVDPDEDFPNERSVGTHQVLTDAKTCCANGLHSCFCKARCVTLDKSPNFLHLFCSCDTRRLGCLLSMSLQIWHLSVVGHFLKIWFP